MAKLAVLALLVVSLRAQADSSDPPRLGTATHSVAPPDIRLGTKAEGAAAPRAALPSDTTPSRPRLRPSHRTQLASVTAARVPDGKLDEIVRAWKHNAKWDAIAIDAGAADAQRAQRSADQMRTYLVQHGIPSTIVIATGHAGATTDISAITN